MGDKTESEIRRLQEERDGSHKGIGLSSTGVYDSDLYGDTMADMSSTVVEADDVTDTAASIVRSGGTLDDRTLAQLQGAVPMADDEDNNGLESQFGASKKIFDREDDYRKQRLNRIISPERHDAFATPKPGASRSASRSAAARSSEARGYRAAMAEAQLAREEKIIHDQIRKKKEEEETRKKREREPSSSAAVSDSSSTASEASSGAPKRSRWDSADDVGASSWDETPKSSSSSRWDQGGSSASSSSGSEGKSGRWDDATPVAGVKTRSRWDQTPVATSGVEQTPSAMYGATPTAGQLAGGVTPMTPMTPEVAKQMRMMRELDERNKPWTEEMLDAALPKEGFEIVPVPETYEPIQTPARLISATPTPMTQSGFSMSEDTEGFTADQVAEFGLKQPSDETLPAIKPEDMQYFKKLLDDTDDSRLAKEEIRERTIMKLLLKVKNGTPPQRKSALKNLTEKARDYGAGPLFNQILPLLMSPSLEDQERHLLVKVIDRVLFKLQDKVRPYVHKILVVIEPLLIDEDYYARAEGREIISNLAKAAGLPAMIATMRPDIDNVDEYVRNTTARAFAVVAQALGVPSSLLLFLKAVCKTKKSWMARHTGIKIVQQIAISMGCAILPHLKQLVLIIAHGLEDETSSKVRTITALALSALAEAAYPYGIESFDPVLKPLWYGIRKHQGKGLAAFLKAIGFIIPLMDSENASYFTKQVMQVVIREFKSAEEEMKKIVLKVVKQCVATEGVEPAYVRETIIPEFFKNFWVRRMALDRRNYRALVETTVEIAQKVGGGEIVQRIVLDLQDESEPYRKMVMETIDEILSKLGAADIDERLEMSLVDGILYAFQEQTSEDTRVMLSGFGTVINSLSTRAKPYLTQITQIIKWRLNNKSAKVRQQAADLIGKIAEVMKECDEEALLSHLGVVLYEYLGEEYPDVLASILGGLKAIVNVIGMHKMTPPVKDLLPRLTPILKNRHEKVQEQSIDLVGRIADRGAEYVSAREWLRIVFELLELLKAHKKAIRRASVNTFGYIAKAIGPQDVLITLLNNLRVQDRQSRVCTTVAIAIVAETCSPFTVLPGLLNEYRVPDMNVQNGVLKSLSFLGEYIGELNRDYVYAQVPLLVDALTDRDAVHRQIASNAVKHISLGVYGLGCEDAIQDLINHVWPNIFETSAHVINAVCEAIEGCRLALGPAILLAYCLPGLFHPARRVREIYWKIYNTMYIGSQDGLTAVYPRLPPSEEGHEFNRQFGDLFI